MFPPDDSASVADPPVTLLQFLSPSTNPLEAPVMQQMSKSRIQDSTSSRSSCADPLLGQRKAAGEERNLPNSSAAIGVGRKPLPGGP